MEDISTTFTCSDSSQTGTSACPFNQAGCVSPCKRFTDFTKINFNMIESIIDFDTVGGFANSVLSNTPLFMHVDSITSGTTSLVNLFGNTLTQINTSSSSLLSFSLQPAFASTVNNRLPPSSAMAFLSKKQIPAIVISDYATQISNDNFESELDDGSQWTQTHVDLICGLANITARNLYSSASRSPQVPDSIQVNCSLVIELLDCLTRNISCALHQRLSAVNPKLGKATSYPGVFSFSTATTWTQIFIFRYMFNITASSRLNSCTTSADCKNVS